jgi:hypothetical protein
MPMSVCLTVNAEFTTRVRSTPTIASFEAVSLRPGWALLMGEYVLIAPGPSMGGSACLYTLVQHLARVGSPLRAASVVA